MGVDARRGLNPNLNGTVIWIGNQTCGISWLAVEAVESEAGPGGFSEFYRLGTDLVKSLGVFGEFGVLG